MKLIIASLAALTCLHLGLAKGYSNGTKMMRKTYIAGCIKGGDAPALTPWPLCPRAADDYLLDHKEGGW
jgi:hypothetical protein